MAKKCMYAGIFLGLFCFGQSIWVETTQSDFADGTFERNIYASHRGGGAVEFIPRFDLNNDGYIDLFTSDRFGPYVRIYWGSANGYAAGNVTLFPSSGGANCDAADLNGDGYPEFIVSHYLEKVTIYWGTAAGPDPLNYFDFPMVSWNRHGVFAADFNKDGYIDIATTQEAIGGNGAVYWGSESGYTPSNRTDLPLFFGVHNIEVADLDRDNWLDLIFVEYWGYGSGQIVIYWGSNNGFVLSNTTVVPGPGGSSGLSVADLDGDGWLDLVSNGWYDPRSYIYWGSSDYSAANMLILNPGYCYGGSAVADFNDDSYLDILYHIGGYGENYQRIYWGSASGYSNTDYSSIGLQLETSGGLVADLNGDGILDIFCNARTPGIYSYVLLGPSYGASALLPAYEDHHAMFREIGNVYDREYYENYLSSVFDAGAVTDWGTIEWNATTSGGSAVLFWVRSGSTAVPDSTWSDWQAVGNGDPIPEFLNARYLQYRARFCYTNPCFLPSLNEVTVGQGASTAILAGARIKPETINLRSQGRFTAFITLPSGYWHHDVMLSTVMCEGAQAVWGNATPHFYLAKFNVQDLVGVTPGSMVEFVVTGELNDGTEFMGCDTIRVIGYSEDEYVECSPNPFWTKTTISLSDISDERITVKIYDVKGALVRSFDDVDCIEGRGSVIWDRRDNSGRRIASGIYVLRVEGKNTHLGEKIIVLD